MWARFAKMHWAGKTVIIGGTAAAIGGVGYWALKEKDNGNEAQKTEPQR